jgi:hypothetical protein
MDYINPHRQKERYVWKYLWPQCRIARKEGGKEKERSEILAVTMIRNKDGRTQGFYLSYLLITIKLKHKT